MCAIGCDPVALGAKLPRTDRRVCTYEYFGGKFHSEAACTPPSMPLRTPNTPRVMGGCAQLARARSGLQPGAPWPRQHCNDHGTGGATVNGPHSSPPALLWRVKAGQIFSFSSPVVTAAGDVYVCGFDDGILYAFNSSGGALPLPPTVDCTGTPALTANNTLVVASASGGALRALSLSNGAALWASRLPEDSIVSGLAVTGGGLVICSGAQGSVLAVRASDGGTAWVWQPPVPGTVHSAPTLSRNHKTVYWTLSLAGLVVAAAVDTGATVWVANVSTTGTEPRSAVLVPSHGDVVYVTNNHAFVAVDSTEGRVLWTVHLKGTALSSPVLSPDGAIAYTADGKGNVLAIDVEARSILWTAGDVAVPPHSTGAVGAGGTVYWGGTKGVYGFSGGTGMAAWRFVNAYGCYGSPAFGLSNTLYIGCNDGGLLALA